MIQPRISIIMPVYNAERTVSRMIDSIIAQTFIEWEMLCIDDGSTDESGWLLDTYAAKDNRIRVYHKKNEGVAMARQIGVDNAHGEYSIHADADDWVEPTMLEEMYAKAKEEDADVVIADYYTTYSNGRESCNKQNVSTDSIETLRRIFKGGVFGALWNKLIRTSLYEQYNAQYFKGINYCEDVLICAQILRNPEVKVSHIDKAYYHYLVNPSSISHSLSRKGYEGLLIYKQKLSEILQSDFDDCKQSAALGVFMEGFRVIGLMTDKEIQSSFAEIRNYAMSNASLRWKLGYAFICIGCYDLARKLIEY